MARKRMITPTIWGDPSFNKLTHSARLLLIGMISNADDHGRERGDPGALRRMVFGCDEFLPEGVTMSGLIQELRTHISRTVHLYEVNGEAYYHFLKWNNYQKQQKDRIQASEYPMCSICVASAQQVHTEDKLSKDKLSKDKLDRERLTPRAQTEAFWEAVETKNGAFTTFVQQLSDRNKVSPEIIANEIQKFKDYWTEKNHSGTKELWQTKKTFEVRRRLATWLGKVGYRNFSTQPISKKGRTIIT